MKSFISEDDIEQAICTRLSQAEYSLAAHGHDVYNAFLWIKEPILDARGIR